MTDKDGITVGLAARFGLVSSELAQRGFMVVVSKPKR